MKLVLFISAILFLSGSQLSAYEIDTFTLDSLFKIQVFIPYYSYLTACFDTLSNDDIFASNTTYITYNLTKGLLLSQTTGDRFYLKNQTGVQYPSYVMKKGQPQAGDVGIFGATRNSSLWGRSFLPNITSPEPGAANLWVACLNSDNLYVIGWDPDSTSQPPAGCLNYAKYNPGVLAHIGSI